MARFAERNIERNIKKLRKIWKDLPIDASKSQKLSQAKENIKNSIQLLEKSLNED